jgi:4-carboxymuconolactone decarboxylase
VTTQPRIPLPDPQSHTNEVAQLLALASDTDGNALLTVAALANHPPLLGPFLGWAAALALEGALAKREHELLALRTAHRCHSAFEWDEHCGYATAAGLDDAEIERVKHGPDAPGWSSRDATLLRLADELHEGMHVSDATLAALASEYPPSAPRSVLATIESIVYCPTT